MRKDFALIKEKTTSLFNELLKSVPDLLRRTELEIEERKAKIGDPKRVPTEREATLLWMKIVGGTPEEQDNTSPISFRFRCVKNWEADLDQLCDMTLDGLDLDSRTKILHGAFVEVIDALTILEAGSSRLLESPNEIGQYHSILNTLCPAQAPHYPPPTRFPENLRYIWRMSELTAPLYQQLQFILVRVTSLFLETDPTSDEPTKLTPVQQRLLRCYKMMGPLIIEALPQFEINNDFLKTRSSIIHLLQQAGAGNKDAIHQIMDLTARMTGKLKRMMWPHRDSLHSLGKSEVRELTIRIAADWKQNRTLSSIQMFKGKFRREVMKRRTEALREDHRSSPLSDSENIGVVGSDPADLLADRLDKELGGHDPEQTATQPKQPKERPPMSDLACARQFMAARGIRPRQHPTTHQELLIINDMAAVLRFLLAVKQGKDPEKDKVRGITPQTLRNWDARGTVKAVRLTSAQLLPGARNWSRFYRVSDIPRCLRHLAAMDRKQKHETRGVSNLKGAAKILGRHPSTLKRLIKTGVLMKPRVGPNGVMQFSRSYLRAAKRLFSRQS